MTTTSPQRPADAIRLGAVQAAIWRNESDEGRINYNITLERLFKDADDKWQSSTSFGRDDCLRLGKVLDRAETRIFELQAKDREAANQRSAPSTNTKPGDRSR